MPSTTLQSAESRFLVYGLIDPRFGTFRYIGKSSSGMSRPRAHARLAKRGHRGYVYNWIRSLLALDLTYEIVVLERCAADSLDACEIKWIAWYRPFGWLTNISDGGSRNDDVRAAVQAFLASLSREQLQLRARSMWGHLTPEQRSDRARQLRLLDSPEARRDRAAKMTAAKEKLPQEVRSAAAQKAALTRSQRMSPVEKQEMARKARSGFKIERSEIGRRGGLASAANKENARRAGTISMSRRTPEERSAFSRAAMMSLSPEERSRRARAAAQQRWSR